MFFLSLLPLAGYFFWLAFLQIRRKPTVLNGVQDFMFLSSGLFGLLTLGPGRLLIPIGVLAFWGWFVWLFWAAFYFSIAYLIAQQLTQRIVIYHCPFAVFVPKLIEHIQELDQQFRFEGNVLFLPDFGIQCTITGDAQHLVLKSTGFNQDSLKWRLFEQNVAAVCFPLRNSSKTMAIVWGIFFLILLAIACFSVRDIPVLVEVFFDYWS
jgi:hypothetical protein